MKGRIAAALGGSCKLGVLCEAGTPAPDGRPALGSKGQLLYGQKTGGGEIIQLMAVPFRGARTMTLHLEGVYKGVS